MQDEAVECSYWQKASHNAMLTSGPLLQQHAAAHPQWDLATQADGGGFCRPAITFRHPPP